MRRVVCTIAIGCALALGLTLHAEAQQRPEQAPRDIIGRRIQGWTGSDRPYFQPTHRPFQSSYARRVRRQMQEMWRDTPAGAGARRWQMRFDSERSACDSGLVHAWGPQVRCTRIVKRHLWCPGESRQWRYGRARRGR